MTEEGRQQGISTLEKELIDAVDLITARNSYGVFISMYLSTVPIEEENIGSVKERLSEEKLTEFGKCLKRAIKGRKFIDLGCGDPEISKTARLIAQVFEVSEYIGVDKLLDKDREVREGEFSSLEGVFKSTFIRSDMLTYVEGLQPSEEGVVFYISGIEPNRPNYNIEVTRQYIKTLLTRMGEVMKQGDSLVLGVPSNQHFSPTSEDLKLMIKVGNDHGQHEEQIIYTKQ